MFEANKQITQSKETSFISYAGYNFNSIEWFRFSFDGRQCEQWELLNLLFRNSIT